MLLAAQMAGGELALAAQQLLSDTNLLNRPPNLLPQQAISSSQPFLNEQLSDQSHQPNEAGKNLPASHFQVRSLAVHCVFCPLFTVCHILPSLFVSFYVCAGSHTVTSWYVY